MGDAAVNLSERYTYGDYRTWPDDRRWELIDGAAWAMSPGPNRRHQGILVRLSNAFFQFLRGKPCAMYIAPFDVLLPVGNEDDDSVETVVQPDLVVYCDRSRLRDYGARGAPDLVAEILSPGTSKRDLNDKYRLYESRGVREYWVVDPGNRALTVFRLGPSGDFGPGEVHVNTGGAASSVLEGLAVDLEDLFRED